MMKRVLLQLFLLPYAPLNLLLHAQASLNTAAAVLVEVVFGTRQFYVYDIFKKDRSLTYTHMIFGTYNRGPVTTTTTTTTTTTATTMTTTMMTIIFVVVVVVSWDTSSALPVLPMPPSAATTTMPDIIVNQR